MKKFTKEEWMLLVIVFFIVFYFFFRSIPNLATVAAKSVYPIEEEIKDKFKKKAIVIKNEEIYKSEGKGSIKHLIDEGKKVASGESIVELKLSDNTNAKNQELYELNKKIEILSSSKNEIGRTKNIDKNPDISIDDVVKQIQKSLHEKDYERAEVLKEKLKVYDKKSKVTIDGVQLLDEDLDKLKKQKNELEKELAKNIINENTKSAGMISYKLDGYEDKFKYSDRNSYKFMEIDNKETLNLKKNIEVNNNDPIFKIMNNFEWYLLIDAKGVKDVENYNIGNNIFVEIEEKPLIGRIEKITKDGKNISLLCKFNTNFEEIYDKRFIDVEVIRYTYKGYKIPKAALIEKNNQPGVMIKDLGGVTKFRPVRILYEDNQNIYIDTGDQNSYIKIDNDKKIEKTIKKFDEILVNPVKIKEGLILN